MEVNIEIRIAHYPPYTSKYNPIEHRLFPHITKACQGVIFKNIDIVNNLMKSATTIKGLTVVSSILNKSLIQFDKFLPDWNYVAVPCRG